jgi:pimeloyl-ACP methyl ester carboxylesterase
MSKLNLIYLILLFLLPQSVIAQNMENTSKLAYDAQLSDYGYDFEVSFFSFNSQRQALRMAYIYLEGEQNKPVVTLMHGKNFNAHYWTPVALYLQKKGYGVLIPDQIGFGKSSRPAYYQYSFAALAHHTQSLLKSLKIKKTIVIGHSMGGMLASRFSLMYPHLTQRLILVNPIGLENYLQYTDYKDTNFFYKIELSKTPDSIRRYQQKNYYDGHWNEQYEGLINFMVGQLQGPDKEQVAWANAQTYDMIFTQPVITEFKDLAVPVRLIIGTRDRTGPGRNWKKPGVDYELGRYDRLGKAAVKLIPDGLLYELTGLGHLPQVENYERFIGVLNKALDISEK